MRPDQHCVRLAERVEAALPLSAIEGSQASASLPETRFARGISADRRFRHAVLWILVSGLVHASMLWSGAHAEARTPEQEQHEADYQLYLIGRYLESAELPDVEEEADPGLKMPYSRLAFDWDAALEAGYLAGIWEGTTSWGSPGLPNNHAYVVGSQPQSLGMTIGDGDPAAFTPGVLSLGGDRDNDSLSERQLTAREVSLAVAAQGRLAQGCLDGHWKPGRKHISFTVEASGAATRIAAPDYFDAACLNRLLQTVPYPRRPSERFTVRWSPLGLW
jgi:hypothetical protein